MVKILKFLEYSHDTCIDLLGKFSFNKKNPLYLRAISLYASILEITSSCIVLTKNNLGIGIPILLRALLEAYVDLYNLCENPNYGYSMEYSFLENYLKLLREAESATNPFLSPIASDPNLRKMIQELERKISVLRRNGHKKLHIKKKFKRAGLIHEYNAIYTTLSSYSHNDIRALQDRHIELNENNDFDVVCYKQICADDIDSYLRCACECLVRATENIRNLLEDPAHDDIVHELRRGLDALIADIDATR